MASLVKPVVNMNGASRESLVQQFAACSAALTKARITLGNNMPHPRDWQTDHRPENYSLAREAFVERIETIDAMAREFMDMALELQREGK